MQKMLSEVEKAVSKHEVLLCNCPAAPPESIQWSP